MKKTGIGISIAFVLMIAGLSLGSFLTKDRDFSENENRYMASRPEFTISDFMSGEYQDKLETYLNDQILFRNGFITAKTAVQKNCGDTDIGGAYVGKDGYDFEKILPEDVQGALVNRNIRAVADFFAYCEDTLPQTEGTQNVSFLLVPTSGLILSDKLPANAILFDQSSYINKIANALKDYNFISPEDILRANADKGVYYRTDHHWTTYGAFLTYQEWCEKTGHVFLGEEAYLTAQVSDTFRGSLYSKILDYDSAYDTIETIARLEVAEGIDLQSTKTYRIMADGKELDSIYQKEYLDKKDKYAFFFGGNYGEVHIENTAQDVSGAKRGNLLIIKDSFANAFAPFLIPEYDNIYMVDLRYSNEDMAEYLTEHEITDVLVLYNVSNFISDMNIYKLSRGLNASK